MLDSSGTHTFRRDGDTVTSPVLDDGFAKYTPGVSDRRGSSTRFTHPDRMGSVIRHTGSSQGVAASRQYDAWGNVAAASGTWAGPFGYAGNWGYQDDSDSGLKLLGHRYYDASTGRFLTRDPIKDGRNWYAYCDNNPLRAVDPEGLAKIFLASRPVTDVAVHTYLIVVDESSGQTWTIGGGPSNGGTGLLVNHSGPGSYSNYEGLLECQHPLPEGLLILDDDKPGLFWFKKLNSIGEEIEAKKFYYDLLRLNSNSFLFTVLQRAGLLDDLVALILSGALGTSFNGLPSGDAWDISPGGPVWAPGWGRRLPR